MARKTSPHNPDRFLLLRNGFYSYNRRVPLQFHELDSRAPNIRKALATSDLAQARAQRDVLERADDEYWAGLTLGLAGEPEAALVQAQARAQALGFTYRYGPAILSEPGEQIYKRLEALIASPPASMDAAAAVGTIDLPKISIRKAFEVYLNEVVADEVVGKSPNQRRNWQKVKERAVANFIELVGDKPIDEITRDDAKAFYEMWRKRVAPSKGRPTHSASSGNRDIGNMRVILGEYMSHLGVDEYKNPFAGLSFSDKLKKTRPPFSERWLTNVVLKKGALETLNDEARGIVLALIETGCRPSEIANLTEEQIVLNAKVPYIDIKPRLDRADPREIKTKSSTRKIPLIGVALEVFKKHRKGFPRYRDREELMSNTLNKYFRDNRLFETKEHKIYSFRHAFEDRMKVAGLDTELRMMLMGHANDRPQYGQGGTMEWRRDELKKIELKFDPSIV